MTKIETAAQRLAAANTSSANSVNGNTANAAAFNTAMKEAQVLPRSAYVPSGEPYDRDKHGSHIVGDVQLVPGAPGYDFDKALPRLKEIAASDRQLASYLQGRGIELEPSAAQTQAVDAAPMLIADPALAAELEAINKSIEPSSAGVDVRQQTAELLQTKTNHAPDKSQLDYWAGIFGLDNQITPDEVERLDRAVSIARDAAALSQTALAKQTQPTTTDVATDDIPAEALIEESPDQVAASTSIEEAPTTNQPLPGPLAADTSVTTNEVEQIAATDTTGVTPDEPVSAQSVADIVASVSEPSVESALLQAQSNLIMTSAQYLSQQIGLNQAQLLTETT